LVRKGDTIPGLCAIAIGALTLLYIAVHPKMAVIGKPEYGGVGPGFFPFVCGVGLLILGLALTLRGIRQNGSVDYFAMTPEKKKNMKIAGLLILMCGLMLAAWKVSEAFYVCLPIYCFAVNKLLKRSLLFSIIFTVVVTAFVYVLFSICFTIRFSA